MISVCVATYNGEKYILEQLKSILCQLSKEDEIIVSDDGSTDSTLELIRGLHDHRIKIYEHLKIPQSHIFDYTTHNFEYALRQTAGEIIFLADQDDVWLPNKVCVLRRLLEHHLLVVSDCKITDQYLSVKRDSYFKMNHSAPGLLYNIVHNSFLGSCMAFRRELLRYALPFPPSEVAHDIWLGLLGTLYGRVAFASEPLILYRRYVGTVSPSGGQSNFSLMFKISYRVKIIRHLLSRIYEKKTHPSHF